MRIPCRGTARSRASSGACCWLPSSAGCSTPWTSCSTPWRVGQLRAVLPASATTWPACSARPRSSCRASAGRIFGYVADRFGRTRALMGTILIFSFASLGAATSQSVLQLLVLARGARHRHGRRVGVGRGARERDVARDLRNKAISIMQSGWALGYILGRRSSGPPRMA